MASFLFPDNGSRYVRRENGDEAGSGVIEYFTDSLGQNRAAVYADRGSETPDPDDQFPNGTTHLDAHGGQVDFRGPNDDTEKLYASVDAGAIFPVFAAPEARLRTVETSVASAQSAASAAVSTANAANTTANSASSAATGAQSTANSALAKSQNLADLPSPSTARTSLGLGGAATLAVGTTAGTVTAGDDSRITGAAQRPLIAALAPLKRILADGLYSTAIQVLGDSTGNDGNEWPALLAAAIGTAYPAWTVQRRLWDDTTQAYGAPTTVQTGTAGARYMDGSTGSVTRQLSQAASPHLSGVIDVKIKVTLSDWTPPTQANLVGRAGAAGSRSWYLFVNTAGLAVFVYSTDGTALTSVFSTAAAGVTDGTASWLRAVFTPDDGAGNKTTSFYKSTDGITWTQIGTTVTTAGAVTVFNPASWGYEIGGTVGGIAPIQPYVHEVSISAGGSTPSIVPPLPELWPRVSASSALVVGAPVLTLVNGSMPGQGITYLGDATRLPKMTPNFGQSVTFLSTSHNETSKISREWVAAYDSWRLAVEAQIPTAPAVPIAQNPETSGSAWYREHAQRSSDLVAYARAKRLPLIDAYKAFVDYGNWQADLMLDTIHPNATGSTLWSNTVKAAFDAAGLY